MTEPVPPAVPISPMIARTMSLAPTPFGVDAVDGDAHVLGFFLNERLRREHVLDFRRADAMRQGPECAMRRGVTVAADDRRSRKRETLLRPDDVDDALPLVALVEIFDAEVAGVGRQRFDLDAALLIRNALCPVGRRDIVIDDGERLLGRANLAAGHPQTLECLRARDLVDEVAIDVEQAGAVRRLFHHVIVENLIVKRFCHDFQGPSARIDRLRALDSD